MTNIDENKTSIKSKPKDLNREILASNQKNEFDYSLRAKTKSADD